MPASLRFEPQLPLGPPGAPNESTVAPPRFRPRGLGEPVRWMAARLARLGFQG
ncbi:hypothetical protein BDY21DRAFT_353475 [Lineolata rhizophorae]|uniref:Uncharacterized protein n=1 Tax=Lineolata rhizophorae TaxID=578093 RepID=A0A6A6NRA9_9PEZI|nr:hypothetical protein BDY21DRAFT_353475 [Lineolata rhizophorae]